MFNIENLIFTVMNRVYLIIGLAYVSALVAILLAYVIIRDGDK